VALCPGSEIRLPDLPEAIRAADLGRARAEAPRGPTMPFPARVSPRITLAAGAHEAEVVRILEALEKHKNNRRRAAAELGISRMGLYKKLHKYGLMGAG
jgi:transcriptional regulator of acetoin/glycerol metabolism